ncbi:MAG TPA: response regulator, partial [Chromatiales bacterium]|nr:response regulator [Chromatiales bacterium]
ELEHKAFDLHELLREVELLFRRQAELKGLRFTLHVEPELPYRLVGDPARIRQILLNLIGNALKFTEQGYVDVRAELLGEERGCCRVRFGIQDTGIGMSAEALERIFEPFTQADDGINRRFGGSGLGTTIAKELAERMGGGIDVRSEPGRGTCFRVELPLATAAPEPSLEADRQLARQSVCVLAEPPDAETIERLLGKWQVPVLQASSMAHALELLVQGHGSSTSCRIFLVDARMLHTPPEALCRMIENQAALRDVALILLEDVPLRSEEREALLNAGFNAILHRPLDERLLFNAIHAVQVVPQAAENVVSLAERYQERARSGPLHILVAEDNPTNQKVIAGILKRGGHRVTLVSDGAQALDALADDPERFDLAILDLNMPKIGGLDVVKALRFIHAEDPVPFIVLSADATVESREACRRAGVQQYLTKPVDAGVLLETVARMGAGQRPRPTPQDTRRTPEARAEVDSGPVHDLDVAKLDQLASIGGDPSFMRELITGFVQDARAVLETLSRYIAAREYGQMRNTVHALKGSAAELGATLVVQACRELEALKPFDMGTERPRVQYDRILEAFERSVTLLNQYLEQREQSTGTERPDP